MLLTACNNAHIPETFTKVDKAPKIYPEYTDVTVPINIAPLTLSGTASATRSWRASRQAMPRWSVAARPYSPA